MTTDAKTDFWNRLSKTRTGMLAVGDRLVPMSPNADAETGTIWFITAKQTDMAQSAAGNPQTRFTICDDGNGLYADITGTLSLSENREKLDEIWNMVADSWFEEGKQDPDLQLLAFRPQEAEIWLGSGALNFMFQIAKAQITGDQPDMGDHTTLRF
ncbi:pyridoxamine 5'-phosphate oxidase family protein [Paracoccus jiaweipingae]|uniref:pyridoxamine 5'-phosphate oxidase family protein n=1 Tax=unclassified Paracoccus (in: a-proteobacteria) TaxID=2688777 RepID=UPI0037901D6F